MTVRKQVVASDTRICEAELERPADIRDELYTVTAG